jgi:hypothetical protein
LLSYSSKPLARRYSPPSLALLAALGSWAVLSAAQYLPFWSTQQTGEPAAPVATVTPANPYGALVSISPILLPARIPVAGGPFVGLVPDKLEARPALETQAEELADRSSSRTAENAIPLPPRRPQVASEAPLNTGKRGRDAQQRDMAAAPATDNRGLFEKLFNLKPDTAPSTALAYARTDDGGISDSSKLRGIVPAPSSGLLGAADGQTAIYDISARAVFMPNGEKLEAHSGLGDLLDDPNRVHVKNRGATPPNVYELSPREQLFHGVAALRMTPLDQSAMYGRDGILAHSYMLGPNGDSNGCISFKDYDRFLQAYMNGQVKRLIVVQRRA